MLDYRCIERAIRSQTRLNRTQLADTLFFPPWKSDGGNARSSVSKLVSFKAPGKYMATDTASFYADKNNNSLSKFTKGCKNNFKSINVEIDAVLHNIVEEIRVELESEKDVFLNISDPLFENWENVIYKYVGDIPYKDQINELKNIPDDWALFYQAFLFAIRWTNALISLEEHKRASKKEQAMSYQHQNHENEDDQKKTVEYYTLDELIKKEMEEDFEEIWIVWRSFDTELALNQKNDEVVPHCLERGVKYTYFVQENIQKHEVDEFKEYCRRNPNLEIYPVPSDTDFIIPRTGLTIYEPNETAKKTRIGYAGHQFCGMAEVGGFRMRDYEVKLLVEKLKSIKEKYEKL